MLHSRKRNLNVCYLNTCSLFPKMSHIRRIIERTNLHVICVSETWLNKSHTDKMVQLDNCNIIRNDRDRTDKVRGGGVALYVRKDLSYAIAHASTKNDKIEYIFVDISSKRESLRIGCVYKPPDVTNNFDKISKVLNTPIASDLIICGDFNINTMIESTQVMEFTEL